MRIYIDPLEMIKEVERDLFEMGITYQTETVQDEDVANNEDYLTIELTGYSYALEQLHPEALEEMMNYNANDVVWAYAEAAERLGKSRAGYTNPGESYLATQRSEEFWTKYLRDGFFAYSYGERWQAQIPYVITELKKYPNTRQAMITMYDRHEDMHNWGGRDRVPCSVSYQFILRNGALSLIYSERSCDFIKFFSTDVFTSVMLLNHVAEKVDVPVDKFIHFIGSLHAFKKDLVGKGIF